MKADELKENNIIQVRYTTIDLKGTTKTSFSKVKVIKIEGKKIRLCYVDELEKAKTPSKAYFSYFSETFNSFNRFFSDRAEFL
jgi:hypothetical protein